MKSLVVLAVLLMTSTLANAAICGRFSSIVKSTLEQTAEFKFELKKVRNRWDTYCFHFDSQGVRCDIIYIGQSYSFLFNKKFSEHDVDSGTVEAYFIQWLSANDGKMALVNTYTTEFEWENDIDEEGCDETYEKLTSTLTIGGKESTVLE